VTRLGEQSPPLINRYVNSIAPARKQNPILFTHDRIIIDNQDSTAAALFCLDLAWWNRH
jgi:hypothetical protein